jgi:hypothetical protein
MMEHPLLDAAVCIWQADLPISFDHWQFLADLGFDVKTLENQHRP